MPIVIIVDAHELAALGDRLIAAGARGEALLEAGMGEIADRVGEDASNIIRDVTPVKSGALRDSTEHTVEVDGPSADITIWQPAESEPGPGGRGGGTEYGAIVRSGRGDVYPVDAQALASSDGFGPVKHAGPADAQPYDEEAAPDIEAEAEFVLREEGAVILREMVDLL